MSHILLKLLRADPVTFKAVSRAYRLIVQRRARLAARASRGFGNLSPFAKLCVVSAIIGLVLSKVLLSVSSPLLGSAFVLTLGALFLLMVVLVDYADVLVNRDEYAVLASHPHNPWSVLLAKIVVLGRSVLLLGLCYFGPSIVTSVFAFRSLAAGLGFLAAAVLLIVTFGVGGMIVSVAILRGGGQSALQRFLPAFQAVYVIFAMSVGSVSGIFRTFTVPTLPETGMAQWLIPPVWFVWPIELAVGDVSNSTYARTALTVASLGFLLLLGSSWIARGFGERLLEKQTGSRPRATAIARRRSRRLGRWIAGKSEGRAVLTIARAHLRGDLLFRSRLLVALVMPVGILVSPIVTSRGETLHKPMTILPLIVISFIGSAGLLIQAFRLSSRPQALWCVLTSPIDRARFSMAIVRLVRMTVLAPLAALLVAVAVVTSSRPLLDVIVLLELAIVCDWTLFLWRGWISEFPFSQAPEPRGGGIQILTVLTAMLVGGLGVAVVMVAGLFGLPGRAVALALLLVTWMMIARWAERRVARKAAEIELGALEMSTR